MRILVLQADLTFAILLHFLNVSPGLVGIGWRITRRYKAEVEKAEVQPLNSKIMEPSMVGQNPKQFGFFKRLEFDGILNINRWCRIFVHLRSNKSPCLAVRKRATSEIYSVRDWGRFLDPQKRWKMVVKFCGPRGQINTERGSASGFFIVKMLVPLGWYPSCSTPQGAL